MSNSTPVGIHTAELSAVEHVYAAIPEFEVGADERRELVRRLTGDDAVLLVAECDGQTAGFLAGYDRFEDGSWYCWLGGVLPEFRQRGVAQALMRAGEERVRAMGYPSIYVKTRNKFVAMRILLTREGYQVVGVDGNTGIDEAGIMHVKELG